LANRRFDRLQERDLAMAFHPRAPHRVRAAISAGLSAGLMAAALALAPLTAQAQEPMAGGTVSHGIAMHGNLRYGPDFQHLDYANPDAPSGGEMVQAATGSFDSINPFIVEGRTAAGARPYLWPSLMARVWDEPFSLYGYVAETLEVPDDRSWVIFNLNPDAEWVDGTPITVDDVIFSMETLRDEGLPGFRRNYGLIESYERIGERSIRFDFSDEATRETVMIIAIMPIISQAYYSEHTFNEATLDEPLTGGPYRIGDIDPGRSISYQRVEDWWGAELPVFRGQYNFDTLTYDYYRDANVALEAFIAGDYTLRREFDAERWVSGGYDALEGNPDATLTTLDHSRPSGMRGFVFNTRRDLFADRRVREALIHAFDFEWVNATLLSNQYERITGMFTGSPLAPVDPIDPATEAMLDEFRAELAPGVFGAPYQPPVSDASGRNRDNLRAATQLLSEAGYEVRDGVLVDAESGEPLTFEILLRSASDERVALAWTDGLSRLGIEAEIRTVDSAQYAERVDEYDFDVTLHHWVVTLSPGAEQYLYWGSGNVDVPGSRNYAGVDDPVVDALIERLENAATYDDLTAAARALDRVLMEGRYVLPLYYLAQDYWAWWGPIAYVPNDPLYGYVLEAFWFDR
jgi:ABC-type oligopeptide transport system substrate-binding subunit